MRLRQRDSVGMRKRMKRRISVNFLDSSTRLHEQVKHVFSIWLLTQLLLRLIFIVVSFSCCFKYGLSLNLNWSSSFIEHHLVFTFPETQIYKEINKFELAALGCDLSVAKCYIPVLKLHNLSHILRICRKMQGY